MATAALDIAQLSNFCSLPQTTIATLLDAPTPELVQTLLSNIAAKSDELDHVKSQLLKANVELENAVRGGESKSRVLRNSIEKAQREAADSKKILQAEEQKRLEIESELEALKTTATASISEVASLNARISSLEGLNRDTLSILESKSTAHDRLAEELSIQHQKTVELRREILALEQTVRTTSAATSSSKILEQALRQEVEQLKRNNEWLDGELKIKSTDYTKYRKEKGARIAELQHQNDEATTAIDSLKRTESGLRKRLDELSRKAEESFSRIQQMQEEAASKEEAFRTELDVANRLAELMKNSADTEKARQKDLQDQLESVQEDASEQIGRISAEVDTEHRERQAAEQRIIELEVHIERLEADVVTWQTQASSRGSVNQGTNGHMRGSPEASSRVYTPERFTGKAPFSVTQLVSDYNTMKGSLEAEKHRNEKLSSTIDDMINDMESRQPEVEELRVDHERLESEIAEMSSLVDTIGSERDQAVKIARKQEGQVEVKIREGEVLRQQLRDLSSQVKVLLMEAHLRDQGIGDIDAERHRQLELLAQAQFDEESLDGMTDTDHFISQNLVTFKNIAQLQEQNTNLIKVTREVGQRMEREEASKVTQEMDDLQQKYERCKDEIKSLISQSQSYLRERDMFRRMLAHRGQLPPDGDVSSMFGGSVDGRGAPATPDKTNVVDSVEQLQSTRDSTDYNKLLKDMQSHFDAYRQEAATDRSTLREQVDNLSRSNSELRNEIGRQSSQVLLAHERYEMLQANYAMLKTENDELQKRSQFFSDSAAKQDLRTQQAIEDLVEAKGLADSMRNELANLKAEKDFWKSVEKRLTEDNETLSNERYRLNSLVTSLQNLLNEREHADADAHRRVSAQVEGLERELQATKRKLTEEVEENKRASLRREFDRQQNQKKIDDLVASLGIVREELVAATTTRDHLQVKIDELNIELRSAEERLRVLQPLSLSHSSTVNGEVPHYRPNDETSDLNKEQELSMQVSDLRRDLDLKRAEVENAKTQIEQYKAISQSSEEQLRSLNSTQELYRQETDKVIQEQTDKIGRLEHQISDLNSRLHSTLLELSDLQNENSEKSRHFEAQRLSLEAEIAQLKDEVDRHATAAQYLQEDLKVQAEIAQQAQQNYENELVKHAEAAKALQSVRGQFNELKIQAMELKTEAESGRTSLAKNEESWAESRNRYEKELVEIKEGRENLRAQNHRLHQQLENLSGQIASLHKHPHNDGADGAIHDSSISDIDNLQEVIKYLRREKEIVDVQLELSMQEAKRLKQQLDYTQTQLDETRLKLNQQRRVEEDSERTSLNHKKLLETINELNTFRESSVTLRNENRQAQAALTAKARQVEELTAQIEPLQTEIRNLVNEKETQAGEIALLRENSNHWQQRAQNILQKYDRVDPAEMEALKRQLQTLESEHDQLKTSKEQLQEEIQSTSARLIEAQDQGNEKVEELRSRLTEQFKTRSKNLSGIIKERDFTLQTLSKEKADLEQRLDTLKSELEEAKVQRDQAIEKVSSQDSKVDGNDPNGSEEGQVDEGGSPKPTPETLQALQENLKAAESRASEETLRLATLESEAEAYQAKIADLENQVVQARQSLDNANLELIRFRNLQQQHEPSSLSADVSEERLEQLRNDLKQAQEAAEIARQDAESLRASALIITTSESAPAEASMTSVSEQVATRVESIRNELDVRHLERVSQLEEQFKKRSEGMKNQLTKKLVEGKEQVRQALTVENEQTLETLRSTHQQELEKLQTRYQGEIDELRRNEEATFAKFKETWLKEHSTTTSETGSNLKTESHIPNSPWKPTEAEAREFVSTNATVRSILKNNITSKIKEAKDALSIELKEEHEKILAERLKEVQDKAKTTQEHAVFMEVKRNALKLSMAENRARALLPKLEVVQKAAEETPQKPVVEVWAVAKDAKPIAVAQPSQQGAAKGQTALRTSNFGQPTPLVSSSYSAQGQLQSTPQGSSQSPPQTDSAQTQNPISISSPSQHHDGLASNQPAPPSQIQTFVGDTQPAASQAPTVPGNLPTKPPQNVGNQHPGAGTGQATSRGLHQSGLPVARGGSGRGAPSRGRGQGIGRGAPQALDTNKAQGQPAVRGSPTSGTMSGGARQFVPQGSKRSRDDSQDTQQGGDETNGKRARGGGGGS